MDPRPLAELLQKITGWHAAIEGPAIIDSAKGEIERFYPGESNRVKRNDLLRRLDRELAKFEASPVAMIHEDPVVTKVAGVYRFPADRHAPLGLILEIIVEKRVVKLVDIFIRPPQTLGGSHAQPDDTDPSEPRTPGGIAKNRRGVSRRPVDVHDQLGPAARRARPGSEPGKGSIRRRARIDHRRPKTRRSGRARIGARSGRTETQG